MKIQMQDISLLERLIPWRRGFRAREFSRCTSKQVKYTIVPGLLPAI
jgi:hypothetical protein